MEFKIPNVFTDQPIYLNCRKFKLLPSSFISLDLTITHNRIAYSSSLDEILFVFGKREPYITLELFIELCKNNIINNNGIRLNAVWSSELINLSSLGSYWCTEYIYIREPEDENKKIRIETIKYVDKIVNVDKIVEKYIIKEYEDLENCFICENHKAVMSFGCCSINYCLDCVTKIGSSKKCAQCRKTVSINTIKSCIKL